MGIAGVGLDIDRCTSLRSGKTSETIHYRAITNCNLLTLRFSAYTFKKSLESSEPADH